MEFSRLKDHLIATGQLTEEQLAQAEDYALSMKIPLDEAIVFLRLMDHHQLGQALAELYGLPYSPTLESPPPVDAKEMLPSELAERLTIFPVDYSREQQCLTVATHDPTDEALQEKLHHIFAPHMRVKLTVCSRPEIIKAIDVHYKGKQYIPEMELELPDEFTIVTPKKELDETPPGEGRGPKKIILLEPELDRYRAIKALLHAEGFGHVSWAASSSELTKAMESKSFDLLLVNAQSFKPQGTWTHEISQDIVLPPISYYDPKALLLGQEYPYSQMSEALISLVAFIIKKALKNDRAKLQEIGIRVRYCKLLGLRLGLSPAQIDATILAAWLSTPGLGELLLKNIKTPYGLEEITNPQQETERPVRIEARILSLVKKYQHLKKKNPDLIKDIRRLRKEMGSGFPSPDNKLLLETFFQVIRDEALLKGIDQPKGHILIVDPESAADPDIMLRLTNEGYEVIQVPDAKTAATKLATSEIDLILSEISLPGISGMQFCRALRKKTETAYLPFFFLTSQDGESLAADCLEAGADDFIKKPADPDLLALKIGRVLATRTQKRPRRGIEGSLAEMNAMDLIQSVATGDKNVKITLESNGQRGLIYIQGGEIIHAEIGTLKGEDAFYQMMAFRDGEFQVVSCTDFPSRTVHGSTMSLLMEGARLVDEATGQPEETEV